MKKYTKDHLWLEETAKGSLEIGVTEKGGDLVGITFAEVSEGQMCVESMKNTMFIDIPVTCDHIENTEQNFSGEFDWSVAIGRCSPGTWKLDESELMDADSYRKYCETL